MTTTKLLYLAGTLLPFGVILLAAMILWNAMQKRRVAKAA